MLPPQITASVSEMTSDLHFLSLINNSLESSKISESQQVQKCNRGLHLQGMIPAACVHSVQYLCTDVEIRSYR